MVLLPVLKINVLITTNTNETKRHRNGNDEQTQGNLIISVNLVGRVIHL